MSDQKRRIVEISEGGKVHPVTSLVKTHPEVAASISKLVTTSMHGSNFDNTGRRSVRQPSRTNFLNISQDIIQRSKDNESMLQLFPELELAAQILISSVISPKDMTSTEITVSLDSDFFTPEVTNRLVELVKDYLNKDYKITPKLNEILRDMLFDHGSHPVAVIPESSLDEFINGTRPIATEALREHFDTKYIGFKNIGILGDPESNRGNRVGLEAFSSYRKPTHYNPYLSFEMDGKVVRDNLVSITDNVFSLRFPEIHRRLRRNTVTDIYSSKSKINRRLSTESVMTDAKMYGLVYKHQASSYNPFARIKTSAQTKRTNIGAPLILHLPSESVIPIHVPGDEKNHIGYFVMIDGEGNPLSRASMMGFTGDLGERLNQANTEMSSYVLQRTRRNMEGGCERITMNEASQIYGDIIEADLLERLRTGVYGDNVSVARNEEVYRIMFSRTLANKHTQLLYVPVELMTYFAYNYDINGIGKSILDDLKMINSLRAMLTFAKTMAALRNSIGRTEVRLKLDEDDPDPRQSIEIAMHEISEMRGQLLMPLGNSSPTDLVTWIQRAGLEFTFEGHPDIPDMNIEFNEKSSDYRKPDDDLYEELKKSSIMGTGISPETVDAGFGPDFATSVITNNVLLVKRVMQIQSVFIPQLTNHCQTIIRNHGGLIDEIRDIIKAELSKIVERSKNDPEIKELDEDDQNILEFLIYEFIDNMEVSLPSPDVTTLENQAAAFDSYSDALDKALDAYMGDGVINDAFSGELGSNGSAYKALVKAYFQRKWLADNNMLSELNELTTKDENGNPVVNFFEMQKDHINALTVAMGQLTAKIKPVAQGADDLINRITEGEGMDEASVSDSGSDYGSDEDTGDEFGMDEEEPTEGEEGEETGGGLGDDEFDMPTF